MMILGIFNPFRSFRLSLQYEASIINLTATDRNGVNPNLIADVDEDEMT